MIEFKYIKNFTEERSIWQGTIDCLLVNSKYQGQLIRRIR